MSLPCHLKSLTRSDREGVEKKKCGLRYHCIVDVTSNIDISICCSPVSFLQRTLNIANSYQIFTEKIPQEMFVAVQSKRTTASQHFTTVLFDLLTKVLFVLNTQTPQSYIIYWNCVDKHQLDISHILYGFSKNSKQ